MFIAAKKQHEYDMMDRRMGEQRIIDEICEKKIVPLEKRTTSLEHYRTAIGASIAAILAWFKYGPACKG